MLKPTQVMVTLDYMMDEICERLAELLYKHIPREVLWRLVSGIAFSEAATARDRERSEAAAAGEGGNSGEHHPPEPAERAEN